MLIAKSGVTCTNAYGLGGQTERGAADIYRFVILSYTNFKCYKTSDYAVL
jgi:hypothetical protein